MKKIILLTLLLAPLGAFAQLSVSGVTGERGFVTVRGAYAYKANEDLTITPMYSYYKDTDDSPSVSKFGLRAEYQPGRVVWGLEGGFVPRSNGYINYSAEGDAKYYFIGRTRDAVEMLFAGAGLLYSHHKQEPGYLIPEYEINEIRANAVAGVTVKPVTLKTVFSKGFFNETPPSAGIIWTDMPYFVTVNRGFVDYYWNSYAVLPTEYVDFHTGYSLYRYYQGDNPYQSLTAGVTVKIMDVAVTGAVEVVGLGKAGSQTYYSLSAGLNF